ncbi:MAG: hypothetical protein IH614_01720 [Desulfuromonadales bacterium]|nr:hypothetical protein [Desulfuromonadales bacterium]
MGGALIPGAAALLLGSLLLALPATAPGEERIFFAAGYRYEPIGEAVDEATADVGLALCGTRCNALSATYDSYLMTMNWRLTKVGGVTERVVALDNPFLDGRCVCTGEEFRVEFYFSRPGVGPGSGAAAAEAQARGQTSESAQ